MDVYLFLGLHNSYFPPDIDFQVLVQVVSSKSPCVQSHYHSQWLKLHFHVRVLSFEWLYCRRLPICPNKCKHKSKHNSKHDFYTIIQNMMQAFKESFIHALGRRVSDRAVSYPQNKDPWTSVTFSILKIRTREPIFRILFGSFRGSFGQKTRSFGPPTVKIGQRPGLSDPEDSDSTHP